jgi:hypothetical protein
VGKGASIPTATVRDSAGITVTENPGVEVPGSEMVTVTQQTDHGIATMVSSVPFGKDPQTAVAGDYFYFGSHDASQIDVFRSDGRLERIIRVAHETVPVTEADFSAYVEEAVAAMADQDQARSRVPESAYAPGSSPPGSCPRLVDRFGLETQAAGAWCFS